MQIGVPKEIKIQEYRVGLTPGAVRELTQHGHQVMVEREAGRGIATATTPGAPPERRSPIAPDQFSKPTN
jgi:NAD/NADP transhydrogenase alpha subunit